MDLFAHYSLFLPQNLCEVRRAGLRDIGQHSTIPKISISLSILLLLTGFFSGGSLSALMSSRNSANTLLIHKRSFVQ